MHVENRDNKENKGLIINGILPILYHLPQTNRQPTPYILYPKDSKSFIIVHPDKCF